MMIDDHDDNNEHFSDQLQLEFPPGEGKTKKCGKCGKSFGKVSSSTVVAHVGSFHDEVHFIKVCTLVYW